MTARDELHEQLRRHYSAARDADAREAPPFAAMLSRARAAASEALPESAPEPMAGARPAPERWSRGRRRWAWALAATPLAVAAGLAAILLSPSRSAERDFERTVAEWSRVERTLTLPTDGLLAVPGSEYLRRLPVLGTGAGASRRPM